ncbi:hypothetical protein ZWY2020_003224 [Hordeum vulgare]|nr:hypothetical protein ZWY2020_003224 [Hordeum vulgare]
MDAALQLAAHGALASIVVTPTYAARLRPAVESSGLPVRLVELPLDLAGTDDVGQIPLDEEAAYLLAASRLRDPLERHLRAHAPPATCIVSDICHPWTAGLAAGLGVPRLSFLECHGLVALRNLLEKKLYYQVYVRLVNHVPWLRPAPRQIHHVESMAASASATAKITANSAVPWPKTLLAICPMSDADDYRCFVGSLSWNTTDVDLKDAFGKFGRVTETKVVLDKFSGRSRGFGFVTFDDKKAMEEAVEAMNGIDLDGRNITVERAQPQVVMEEAAAAVAVIDTAVTGLGRMIVAAEMNTDLDGGDSVSVLGLPMFLSGFGL